MTHYCRGTMREKLKKIQVEIFLLIFLIGLVEITHALDGNITVTCGQLVVHGYNACEIEHNDRKIHYVGPAEQVFPDLFGFITFDCDGDHDYLASNFNCTKCGFPCSPEEQSRRKPSERPSDAIPFWSGTISGICAAALIGSFVFGRLHRAFDPNWFGRRTPTGRTATLLGQETGFTEETASDNDAYDRRSTNSSTSLKVLIVVLSICLQIFKVHCHRVPAGELGRLTEHHEAPHGLGSCDMKFLTSYGCSACNDTDYVMLVPASIRTHGLMFFLSNCSFDKKTVHCEDSPTKLMLRGKPEACFIKTDAPINDSYVTFHLQYPDLSHPLKSFDGNDLYDSEFLSTFFTAFVESALMFFVFGLIVTITLRIMRPY